MYFDSFGNVRPPKEHERHLANSVIEYNRTPHQHYSQNNYGQLYLQFLSMDDKQFKNRRCLTHVRLKHVANV